MTVGNRRRTFLAGILIFALILGVVTTGVIMNSNTDTTFINDCASLSLAYNWDACRLEKCRTGWKAGDSLPRSCLEDVGME